MKMVEHRSAVLLLVLYLVVSSFGSIGEWDNFLIMRAHDPVLSLGEPESETCETIIIFRRLGPQSLVRKLSRAGVSVHFNVGSQILFLP